MAKKLGVTRRTVINRLDAAYARAARFAENESGRTGDPAVA